MSKTKRDKDYEPGKQFFDSVYEVDDGRLCQELDEKLSEVIAGVLMTGNKGKICLELNVKRKGMANQLQIDTAIKTTVPQRDMPSKIVFADSDGNIYRDDPNQGQLELDSHPVRVAPTPRENIDNIARFNKIS